MALRTADAADAVSVVVRTSRVGLLGGAGACMAATKYRGSTTPLTLCVRAFPTTPTT
jgi:hypothetical protein